MKRQVAALAIVAALIGSPAVAAAGEPPAGAAAVATDSVTRDENDRVIEGAAWTQHHVPFSDGSGLAARSHDRATFYITRWETKKIELRSLIHEAWSQVPVSNRAYAAGMKGG